VRAVFCCSNSLKNGVALTVTLAQLRHSPCSDLPALARAIITEGMLANPECQLPPTAQEIARLIGREATLLIAIKATNRCIYVPKGDASGHWIARLIGPERFAVMQREFGGMQLTIAKCSDIARAERDNEIRKRFKDGKTIAWLALEYGLTTRRIWSIVDARQVDYMHRKMREAGK